MLAEWAAQIVSLLGFWLKSPFFAAFFGALVVDILPAEAAGVAEGGFALEALLGFVWDLHANQAAVLVLVEILLVDDVFLPICGHFHHNSLYHAMAECSIYQTFFDGLRSRSLSEMKRLRYQRQLFLNWGCEKKNDFLKLQCGCKFHKSYQRFDQIVNFPQNTNKQLFPKKLLQYQTIPPFPPKYSRTITFPLENDLTLTLALPTPSSSSSLINPLHSPHILVPHCRSSAQMPSFTSRKHPSQLKFELPNIHTKCLLGQTLRQNFGIRQFLQQCRSHLLQVDRQREKVWQLEQVVGRHQGVSWWVFGQQGVWRCRVYFMWWGACWQVWMCFCQPSRALVISQFQQGHLYQACTHAVRTHSLLHFFGHVLCTCLQLFTHLEQKADRHLTHCQGLSTISRQIKHWLFSSLCYWPFTMYLLQLESSSLRENLSIQWVGIYY